MSDRKIRHLEHHLTYYQKELETTEYALDMRDKEIEKLKKALEWAKPYVARIRDTEIIDRALNYQPKG